MHLTLVSVTETVETSSGEMKTKRTTCEFYLFVLSTLRISLLHCVAFCLKFRLNGT